MAENGSSGFQTLVGGEPPTVLFAERLRDGRVALGTRVQREDGSWEAGELHFLDPSAVLALAAWLSETVEAAWIEPIRERQPEPLRTAHELYGEGGGSVARLAAEIIQEIPPDLVTRAMILLANSIGPEARERLVQRLNRTTDVSEDAILRRRLADESDAFAYAVAGAALYDAIARGVDDSSEF